MDDVKLHFDEGSLTLLNVIIGLVMFGVALDLKLDDFKRVIKEPKGPIIGLIAQFLLLPAFSYLLTLIIRPSPSVALGMIMVAACPGGNLSNFVAHLAKGRTVLSVTMTAVSTALAVVMTPINVSFWGSMNPKTQAILTNFNLSPWDLFGTVLVILGVPLIAGMTLAARSPDLAEKLRKPFKILSILFFVGFIFVAFLGNFEHFINFIGLIFLPVALQNAMALSLGYGTSRVCGLGEAESRAVSIEVGIQNSGLGLILIFNFFNGLGGMAVVAAWYGIWHAIAGLSLAWFWARRDPNPESPAENTQPAASVV